MKTIIRAFAPGFLGLVTFALSIIADGRAGVAYADVWTIVEGVCKDWTGEWTMATTDGVHWHGHVKQDHTGGTCHPKGGSMARLTGRVDATIDGTAFQATKTGTEDKNNCEYFGTIVDNKVKGGKLRCNNGTWLDGFDLHIKK